MEIAKKYDLTKVMAPFFDVHMVSPLLDHLAEVQMYDAKEITKEKIRIILRTNMIELVEDEYQKFPDDPEMAAAFNAQAEYFENRKNQIFDQIDHEPEDVQKVAAFFSNESLLLELKSTASMTIENISSHHSITVNALDSYYRFAKFKYECGMYKDAEDMLGNYLSVVQPQSSSVLGALWGRLACRIVQANWEESLKDLIAVKEAIDSRGIAPMDQLRLRGWLLHWGLFVFMNQRDGFDAHSAFFNEKHYLQTIENLCPWMLRYFTVTAILAPSRKTVMKDLLAEIQSMSHVYSDPFTKFIECLYDRFDFDEAQIRLKECRSIIESDFLMNIHAERFLSQARLLICELYCTVNRRVDISTLAEKLELTGDEAEKWMIDMVRTAANAVNLEARIDSAGKQVIMSPQSKTAHQQVVDKTRDMTVRSGMLSDNLEKLLQDQSLYIKSR